MRVETYEVIQEMIESDEDDDDDDAQQDRAQDKVEVQKNQFFTGDKAVPEQTTTPLSQKQQEQLKNIQIPSDETRMGELS